MDFSEQLPQWGVLLIVFSALISLRLCRYSKIQALTYLYLCIECIIVFIFKEMSAGWVKPIFKNLLSATALFSFSVISATAVIILGVKEHCARLILYLFMPVAAVALTILHIFDIKPIAAASVNGVLIALCSLWFLNAALESKRYYLNRLICWFVFVLCTVSLAATDASNPVGTLSVGAFILLLAHRKYAFAALAPLFILSISGWYIGIETLFNPYDRFQAQQLFFGDYFTAPLSTQLFGFGPGSFEILSQWIQYREKWLVYEHMAVMYDHMHSDWLQFIWEYGIIGFLLIVSTAAIITYKLRSEPLYIACFIAACASLCFDFPIRYPGFGVFVALLAVISLSNPRGRNGISPPI